MVTTPRSSWTPTRVPPLAYVLWSGYPTVRQRQSDGLLVRGVDEGHTGSVFLPSVDMVGEPVQVFVSGA